MEKIKKTESKIIEEQKINTVVSRQKHRLSLEEKEAVTVIEDEQYHERLDQLRELSNQLNKLLQKKLDQLPISPYFSWNKSKDKAEAIALPKVLHIAILFRPEFFYSTEEKTKNNRFNTDDDQLSIFIHVKPDKSIQIIRGHRGYSRSAYGIYFMQSAIGTLEERKGEVERLLQADDLEGITELIFQCFSGENGSQNTQSYIRSETVFFQEAYTLQTIEEAKKYFSSEERFLYQPSEIIRNLAKVALTVILKTSAEDLVNRKQPLNKIRELLAEEARNIFDIEVPTYPKTTHLGSHIPENSAYTAQIIQKLIKKYKPQLMGWAPKS